MVIELSAEDEALIRRRLDSGAFSSPTDVVHEALFRLEHEEFESAIDLGLEQIERGEIVTPEQSRENQARRKAEWLTTHNR